MASKDTSATPPVNAPDGKCWFCLQPMALVARMEERLKHYEGQIYRVARCRGCMRAYMFWSTAGQPGITFYPSTVMKRIRSSPRTEESEETKDIVVSVKKEWWW